MFKQATRAMQCDRKKADRSMGHCINEPEALRIVSDFHSDGPDGAAQEVITEYPVPSFNSQPVGITSGPDGALWFTKRLGSNIGRITTSGTPSTR